MQERGHISGHLFGVYVAVLVEVVAQFVADKGSKCGAKFGQLFAGLVPLDAMSRSLPAVFKNLVLPVDRQVVKLNVWLSIVVPFSVVLIHRRSSAGSAAWAMDRPGLGPGWISDRLGGLYGCESAGVSAGLQLATYRIRLTASTPAIGPGCCRRVSVAGVAVHAGGRRPRPRS